MAPLALMKELELELANYEQIDHDHAEFLTLLNQLHLASNAEFPALFKRLFEYTEQHFEYENQLMLNLSFAGIADHKAEHIRVLGEFKQFKTRVDKGLVSFGRSFVTDRLPQWFQLHTQTMDAALTAYLKLLQQS